MPRYRTVVFDCDSTLSAIEGIDELAVDCRADVARLTDAAMRGEIPLEEVYGRRLRLVQPTRSAMEALAREYVARLVPDASETIAALRRAGVDVRILSGGLRPAVLAVAMAVGVPATHVAAVDISFGADGSYVDFDDASPLAVSGGKRIAIERLRCRGCSSSSLRFFHRCLSGLFGYPAFAIAFRGAAEFLLVPETIVCG